VRTFSQFNFSEHVKGNFSKRGGFTILEVMLATTIFALVIVSLASTLSRTIQASAIEKLRTHIRLILDSRLAEALQETRTQIISPSNGWQKIEKESLGLTEITYEKQILLKNFKNNKNKILPSIYSLTVRARWTEGKDTQQETAEIFIYKPQ
jgi:type II secretion system protein I